jgi:hypothetical protein
MGGQADVSIRSKWHSDQLLNETPESGMFNYLERKTEKRIFFSYLYRFGLSQEHLSQKATRILLNDIFNQSSTVSRRFHEPVSSVARNIISTAAWGTIYCLLGPTRMIEIEPEYRDICDEVEMELMMSCVSSEEENNIYRQVFAVLSEFSLCHPEVTALIEACVHCASDTNNNEVERYVGMS